MPIKLTYLGETSVPVEVEGLTPDWTCDKSLAEIERFDIFHGNRKVRLAEMFAVAGGVGDKRIDFEGNLAGVHWIGAHMRSGQIYVRGTAGRHVGSELRGGEIRVEGDAGGWVGCEMRGGLIHVLGDAGHMVGAALRGSAKGMTGGTILIDGNAGNEIGFSMQQGLIAIGGEAGDMLGYNMTDGTMLVMGNCGNRPGAGMRGGTIGLFGQTTPAILPSFQFNRTSQPDKFRLVVLDLRSKGSQMDDSRLPAEVDVYLGDLVESGTGEIHVRHVGAT